MPQLIDTKPGTVKGRQSLNNEGVVRTEFTRVYQIWGDSTSDSETYILENTPGLPALGQIVSGAICKSRRADEIETHCDPYPLWEATLEFDTDVPPPDDPQNTPPELLTPEWEWDGEDITTIIENDQVDGAAITTSADEPLPLEGIDAISILTIKRYEISFSPSIQQLYMRKVNSEPFWGAPAGTAYMAKIRDRKSDKTRLATGLPYREVTYTIKFYFRKDEENNLIGWRSRIRMRGTYYYDFDVSNNVVKVQFVDERGTPTLGDLDAEGGKLAEGADPEYRTYNRFGEIDFNQLGLGPF